MTNDSIVVVTPVYNDWASFEHLAREIDDSLCDQPFDVTIVAVNDGSTEPLPNMARAANSFRVIRRIEVLHLSRNIGHQRAIAAGLSHVEDTCNPMAVIVMDADGEDQPATMPVLLAVLRDTHRIVFARRSKRREDAWFILFYYLYRMLFFLLTGREITFGNYCAIPGSLLKRVVHLPDIWNHFAAGIVRSGLPLTSILISRGLRYAGQSNMSFVGLVIHGLSAISVYTDVMAVRLILLTSIVIVATFIAAIGLLAVRYLTPLAIPGWATTVALGLVIILFQALMFSTLISFSVLNARNTQAYVPFKQYRELLFGKEVLYEQS